MIIEKITIHNYRNFSDFEIELKPFNLIIGENNIGKTNLLNALGLIFSPDITFYQKRNLEIDDINYDALIKFKNEVKNAASYEDIKGSFPDVRIEILMSGFNSDQEAIVGDWFTGEWNADISKNKAKITYRYSVNHSQKAEKWFNDIKKVLKQDSPIEAVNFPIEYYSYSIYGGDDQSKRIDYYWLSFLKMELLEALRDAKTQLSAGGKNTLLNRILSVQTENKIDEIKKRLLEIKKLIAKDDKGNVFKSIKDGIESFLKKISIEESDSIVDFDFLGVESSDILKKMNLIYGTTPINVERNGLGRNNLLYISLLLSQLMQQVESEDKKVFFRLIGIEEPEAHLHPHLQIHLSRNIDTESSVERQIVITSHSTHITSQLSLEDTIVLYRDENDKQIKPYYLFKKIPPDSIKYLSRFLDATKSTMFFARQIILVEGISEQLLMPEFFRLTHENKSIEQLGISLVNVNGVAFSHFLEVIRAGYFLKSVVFTDSDSAKATSRRAEELRKEYGSSIIQVHSTKLDTFEKDIINGNKNGDGKELLFEALSKTRPINGPKLKLRTSGSDIGIDEFFDEIENYKAEFAMNLLDVMKAENNRDKHINVPQYIADGFGHIVG